MNSQGVVGAVDGVTVFEMPFQWDDGKFVSPFVVTGQNEVDDLVQLLQSAWFANLKPTQTQTNETATPASAELTPQPHPSPSPSKLPLFVDLGCGNGCVVAAVVNALPWLRGMGYDLDEHLIDTASKTYLSSDPTSRIHERLGFEVKDLCESLRGLLADAAIAFVYLLPEALEMLAADITACVRHWGATAATDDALCPSLNWVVSHKWDVPCLAQYKVELPGRAFNLYMNPKLCRSELSKATE
jgi:hypothetical protein